MSSDIRWSKEGTVGPFLWGLERFARQCLFFCGCFCGSWLENLMFQG
jgi:hypothetical protein